MLGACIGVAELAWELGVVPQALCTLFRWIRGCLDCRSPIGSISSSFWATCFGTFLTQFIHLQTLSHFPLLSLSSAVSHRLQPSPLDIQSLLQSHSSRQWKCTVMKNALLAAASAALLGSASAKIHYMPLEKVPLDKQLVRIEFSSSYVIFSLIRFAGSCVNQ